jgi:putative ABC transport system permease protein
MSFLQIMFEAFRSLAANRLRTALTMLGIVIGIASVVLMLGVGDAVRGFIDRELSVLGSNQLIVQRGAPTGDGRPRRQLGTDAPYLTLDDARAMNSLSSVAAAAATLQSLFPVLYGDDSSQSTVLGVTPEMFRVRNWVVDQGVPFSDDDVRSANRVILIGSQIAEAHYLRRDPLGQVIRVGGRPFTVIGVLAGSGRTLDGTDLGELLVVPITALPLTLPQPRSVHYINVQSVSELRLKEAENDVAELLRDRRRITGDETDDFNITNLASIAQTGANIAAALSIGLGVVGAVSLIVGGIGIMNIMLVSVSERVREIGIRMAIGAKPRHVLTQFLAEAVMMCVLGGVVGIALAAAGVWGVNYAGTARGFSMQLSATHVLVAVLFSTGVGLFFGWYPARRASKLLPIECLRQE